MTIYLFTVVPEGFKELDLQPGKSYADHDCLSWNGASKAKNWQPPELTWVNDDLTEGDEEDGDFIKFLGGPPVISEKAYAELRDILSPFVEFLPVLVDGRERYILNVTNVLDLLDREKSKYKIYGDGKVGPCQHGFLHEQPTGHHIFKVNGYLPRTFIGDELKSKIESSELTGALIREYKNPQ